MSDCPEIINEYRICFGITDNEHTEIIVFEDDDATESDFLTFGNSTRFCDGELLTGSISRTPDRTQLIVRYECDGVLTNELTVPAPQSGQATTGVIHSTQPYPNDWVQGWTFAPNDNESNAEFDRNRCCPLYRAGSVASSTMSGQSPFDLGLSHQTNCITFDSSICLLYTSDAADE